MEFRDKLKFEKELEDKKLKGSEEELKVDYSLKKGEKINIASSASVKTNNTFGNKDFKFKFNAPAASTSTSKQTNQSINNATKKEQTSNINLIDL